MKNKIRILFYNVDGAGVNYYRTQSPAIELDKNHSDEFYVEINSKINFDDPETIEYLKTFDIIHYHRQLSNNIDQFKYIAKILKENKTILVVDIDDHWHLPKQHPYYQMSVDRRFYEVIIENLKLADYVSTTTELFAKEISNATGKDLNDIGVFYNSVNPEWMEQFQDNWKPDPDDKVRITYMAGSSHLGDLKQLETVTNVLNADTRTKDKFKIILAGWDTQGTTTEVIFNKELEIDLRRMGLINQTTIKMINQTKGNIDMIPGLPDNLKDKYRGNVFITNKRKIRSDESIYYEYEKILTDNHRILKPEYVIWLNNFEVNGKYDNEGNYARRWTKKANKYATVLDETDIMIAPLTDNLFNRSKSNLKQMECWSRKIPIICSDMPPYNVHGKHMENCILVPTGKQAHKYWKKYLKQLIIDSDLRIKLGEQLHNDFKDKYHLTNVTKKRVEFYKKILNNK